MKHGIKKRILSLVLCISIVLPMIAQPMPVYSVESEESIAPITNPFTPESIITLPDGTSAKSQSYRIPSMVTLADGTIVAAADIRWNTTYDGGGLDTLVAKSTDGGKTWKYKVANYLGDNGNEYDPQSTTFIDPNLLVAADGQTVYMLVDLYAYGIALNGRWKDGAQEFTYPAADTGFDANGNLKLSDDNHYSYNYYLKDGKIYDSSNNVVKGYEVDAYFNISYTQNGVVKESNLFFADSPFKVARTQYLYLTKSTDGGESWSEPTLLDVRAKSRVPANEDALLVAPGNSITTSKGIMVYPAYSYTSNAQYVSLIYSVDGVNWERTANYTGLGFSSEGSIVELKNGNLRVFVRNKTGYLCYVDFDMDTMTWSGHTETTVPTNSNTQLSAITYSQTFNGQQVILVSCPTGPNEAGSDNNDGSYRTNGKIFVGFVGADGTMSWLKSIDVGPYKTSAQLQGSDYKEEQGFFAYSCLTERSDGSIAILYENNQFGWGASGSNGDGTYNSEKVSTYYTINFKAFDLEKELKDKNITFDAADVTVSGNGIPFDSRFVAKEIFNEQEIENILIGAGADDVLHLDMDDNNNIISRNFSMDAPYRFLELSFLNENDDEVQPDEMVTVTMDAASLNLADGDHFMVYHIHPNSDGTYTSGWLNEGKPFITSDGKVSFAMDQFSYVLVLNSSYSIENKSFYLVQNYYDNNEFPVSTNGNWGLLGVYIDADNVAHVLIGQLTNNINRDKVGYISINGEQYSGENISIFDTGKLTQLTQKNTSGEIVETVDLSTTNLTGKSSIQAVWDVKADKLAVTEVFKLLLHATAGGFEIGETEVDLKLEYSITKDVVSIDGNATLSGNSVVLPTILTEGGINSVYFGKEVIYRITARNTGDVDLHGVKLSDILPSGFYQGNVYTSSDGVTWTQATVTNEKIEVATLDLGAHAAQNYYVKVTIASTISPGTYTNTAELNVNNVVTNATAEVILQNPDQGVLTVSKEVTPALPAITDSYFTFTLTGNGITETFRLRHGESTSFILPAGTYTVTEANHTSGKFTAQNATLSTTIAAGGTAELKFVNTYAGADYFHINYVPVGSGTVTVKNESVSIDIGTYGPIYGSTAETFTGATFQGWYHDEACTGEPLSTEPAFIPEMPADGWQSGKTYTYYAKFEETDASLQYVIVDPAGNKFNEDQSWAKLSSYSESVDVISGQVTGSTATVLDNAYKFVGWYATADCTGTSLSTDAHYTPTKSSELWTSATYYAKFEYNLASLTIEKDGVSQYSSIDPNQTFIFNIKGNGIDLDVTVNGNNDWSTTINGLTVGQNYTITEKTDWSWRYNCGGWNYDQDNVNSITPGDIATITLGLNSTITFTNTRDENKWLDGDTYEDNLFDQN